VPFGNKMSVKKAALRTDYISPTLVVMTGLNGFFV
jgi:hypothetical protein